MSIKRILLLARKEGWHIVRDMRTVYLAFGIPLVMLVLFGWALSTDVEHVRLIVVDMDHTPTSRALVKSLENSRSFVVANRLQDPRGMDERFKRGEAEAALIIPRGFERDIDRNDKGVVQLIADGTNANDAAIAIGFSSAEARQLSMDTASLAMGRKGMTPRGVASPPIEVKTRNWFNPELKSKWYLVPGLIAVIMAMMTSILMALTVAREWERGTMEQLLVTPATRTEILLGKLIPYFLIGLGQLVLVSSFGVLLFHVPLRGDIGLLLAASSFFLLAGLGAGLFISVATRNQQVAMQFAVLTSMLPALLLSGFMSPIASMPPLIQKITYVIPARYFLVVLRGLFLKGVPFDAIRGEMAALAGFAALFLILGVLKFKTRLD